MPDLIIFYNSHFEINKISKYDSLDSASSKYGKKMERIPEGKLFLMCRSLYYSGVAGRAAASMPKTQVSS